MKGFPIQILEEKDKKNIGDNLPVERNIRQGDQMDFNMMDIIKIL